MIISRMRKAFKMKLKTRFLVSRVPSLRLTKQTNKNVTDINFKCKWQDEIWIFNHYAVEAKVWSRPMCKYGLGVSLFKDTPRLARLIYKFDKWSKIFSLIIVGSLLTLQVYIFG